MFVNDTNSFPSTFQKIFICYMRATFYTDNECLYSVRQCLCVSKLLSISFDVSCRLQSVKQLDENEKQKTATNKKKSI